MEVNSLEQLREVQLSFDEVLEENLSVQNKIDNFRERFEAVGVAANQFDSVQEDIITSLHEAHTGYSTK